MEELHLDPFALTKFNNSVLHKAAESGNIETIEYVLSLGLDEHALSTKKTSMIQKAAFRSLEAVQFFLNRGHDPYHVNLEGDSAIIIAAERGRKDVIQYLYENYRLSLFAKDLEKSTAYEMAVKGSHKEVLEYLDEISAENWANRHPFLALRFDISKSLFR